jgi:recombination protein RecT
MAGRQSVREAAARGGNGNGGGDGGEKAALKKLDDDVRGARDYLRAIVPAHVNADQYVAIVIGALHKDRYLAEAAMRNPGSLMAALAEGARLGLVPGDGFALVPFKRAEGDGPKIPVITPVTEYTGELALMYNTGRVEAVVCEVVHARDTYIRGKHPHDPPVFVKGGQLDPEGTDKPFASGGSPAHAGGRPGDRGAPIGAFGYAVLMSGGVSRVVEMGADEILLHRDSAPSKKVWDGPFWRSQWMKTIIHEMYKWVPKSPEYAAEMMRASAAAARVPAGVVMGQLERPMLEPGDTEMGAIAAAPPAAMGAPAAPGQRDPVPGRAEPGGQRAERRRGRGKAAEADGSAPADPVKLDTLGALLDDIGIDDQPDRLRIVAMLGGSAIDGEGIVPLTNDQADTVAGHLRAVIAKATTDEPAVVLLWERVAVAERAAEAAGGGGEPDGEDHSAGGG